MIEVKICVPAKKQISVMSSFADKFPVEIRSINRLVRYNNINGVMAKTDLLSRFRYASRLSIL